MHSSSPHGMLITPRPGGTHGTLRACVSEEGSLLLRRGRGGDRERLCHSRYLLSLAVSMADGRFRQPTRLPRQRRARVRARRRADRSCRTAMGNLVHLSRVVQVHASAGAPRTNSSLRQATATACWAGRRRLGLLRRPSRSTPTMPTTRTRPGGSAPPPSRLLVRKHDAAARTLFGGEDSAASSASKSLLRLRASASRSLARKPRPDCMKRSGSSPAARRLGACW